MKKLLLASFILLSVFALNAQTQPMKFMGIGMNSTMSTFVSKLKGKGFTEDVSHSKPNMIVMKGVFAGEKVKIEIRCAAKTHLVYGVYVYFNMSTRFNYQDLKNRLNDKYGQFSNEINNLKDNDESYVKYTTDYSQWFVDRDEETGNHNTIVLSKCSYHSTSPYIITYLDGKNSKIEMMEVNSDF